VGGGEAGSGKLEEEERERVRATMLAFLLHSSKQSLVNALQPFGGEGQAALSAALPEGSHPVLRVLTAIDAGVGLPACRRAR
jgi:hypothetical protein